MKSCAFTKHIERLDRRPRATEERLMKLTGYTSTSWKIFLQKARLVPWVLIDENPDGYLIRIDWRLRDICDRYGLQATLPDASSIAGFLSDLRHEITARRKANHDDRQKKNWNPENVVKRFQSELLDYIESQLDRVTPLLHAAGNGVPIQGVRSHELSQDQGGGRPPDAGTRANIRDDERATG